MGAVDFATDVLVERQKLSKQRAFEFQESPGSDESADRAFFAICDVCKDCRCEQSSIMPRV